LDFINIDLNYTTKTPCDVAVGRMFTVDTCIILQMIYLIYYIEDLPQ